MVGSPCSKAPTQGPSNIVHPPFLVASRASMAVGLAGSRLASCWTPIGCVEFMAFVAYLQGLWPRGYQGCGLGFLSVSAVPVECPRRCAPSHTILSLLVFCSMAYRLSLPPAAAKTAQARKHSQSGHTTVVQEVVGIRA